MARKLGKAVLGDLDALFNVGTTRGLTDGQLLERFAAGPAEAAELAFAALVERHAAMVLRVCRSQLRDPDDARDAAQATFLVLVRKARGLWVRDSLGPWLHQVALRTASQARSAEARRRRHERSAAGRSTAASGHDDGSKAEQARRLHEEIDRLPERYRVPIVLCDLQGLSSEEAARRMGRPVGTVKSWRSRGRARLRARLARAGVGPEHAPAAVLIREAAPPAWTADIARAALRFLSHPDPIAAGIGPAACLARGVLQTMLMAKLRTAAAICCVLSFSAFGLATVAQPGGEGPPGSPGTARPDRGRPTPPEAAEKTNLEITPTPERHPIPPVPTPGSEPVHWPLSLREAVRIGLDNAGFVRPAPPGPVDGPDSDLTITASDAGVDFQQLRADAMARVRLIELAYWELSREYVRRWAAETAVGLADEVRAREEATDRQEAEADLTGVHRDLERFRLGLVEATDNLIKGERRLRQVLGLPTVDERWIVPSTPPADAAPRLDWDASLATLLQKQPDVLRAKARSEGARGERAEALAKQTIAQTTRSLSRTFQEVDANDVQRQSSANTKRRAAAFLDRQRAAYREGRLPAELYLEAIGRYAVSAAEEAQFLAALNISLMSLEEVRGTLLDRHGIMASPAPTSRAGAGAEASESVPDAVAASLEGRGATPNGPGEPGAKTFSFRLSLGVGREPIEVRGSITIAPAGPAKEPDVP